MRLCMMHVGIFVRRLGITDLVNKKSDSNMHVFLYSEQYKVF